MTATSGLIGVEGPEAAQTVELAAGHGSRLVLVTDGLAETRSRSGEFYGRQRLRDALVANRQLPVREFVSYIVTSVSEFRGTETQADDLTIVAIDL